MTLTDLFPAPQSQPAKELAQLGARRRELLAQERDALTALEAAQAEHARLAGVVADDEARAVALGEERKVNKGASTKVDKLARQVEEHSATSDLLGRAILTIDEDARRVVTNNCNELVNEAIDQHDHARQRITELVVELNQQQAALRSAFVAAQAVLSAAGHAPQTARMAVPPSLEMLVREGGAPQLLRDDDRAPAV